MQYIRRNWKAKWQKPAFASVKALWETYKEASIANIPVALDYKVDIVIKTIVDKQEINKFNLMA